MALPLSETALGFPPALYAAHNAGLDPLPRLVVLPVVGIGYSDNTARQHMVGLTSELSNLNVAVESPTVPDNGGTSGDIDTEFKRRSQDIDDKIRNQERRYANGVFPVYIGESFGGVLALRKYIQDRRQGIDSAVITLNTPHGGLKPNPLIPEIPFLCEFLRSFDSYSIRAKEIGRFSLETFNLMDEYPDHNNVTYVGGEGDVFGHLSSLLPIHRGAKRIVLSRSGRHIEGFGTEDGCKTVKAPSIEHTTAMLQKEVVAELAKRVLALGQQIEVEKSGNVIRGNFPKNAG